MILTVTANPSIDTLYILDDFKLGQLNRSKTAHTNIGGKGINAGRAAALLGHEVILTGFLSNINGKNLEDMLKKENLFIQDFVKIDNGQNRSAITIVDKFKQQTEIIESGPTIKKNEHIELLNKIIHILSNNKISCICINGSVNSDNSDFYSIIMDSIYQNGPHKILLDVSGPFLKKAWSDKVNVPFLIKPNLLEFSDLIGKKLTTKSEAIRFILNENIKTNIPIVFISCGEEGAIVIHNDKLYDVKIPNITVVNPTGAGDSIVGGFAAALERNLSLEDSIKFSIACGISNTMNEGTGVVNLDEIKKIMPHILVTDIS